MFDNFSWDDVISGLDKGLDVIEVIGAGTPVGAIATIADSIVESKTKGVKIDNNQTIMLLDKLAKSTGNDLDDDIICVIKSLLECKSKRKENGQSIYKL